MKEILNRIRNQLFYGGLTRSAFKEIQALLDEENYYMVVHISAGAVLLGLLMILLTLLGYVRGSAINAYMMLAASSAIVFLFAVLYVRQHKSAAAPAMAAELLILIIYALLIGTVFLENPDGFAVTYSAVIVLIPFFLVAPPLPACLLILFGDLLVFLITPAYKTPAATSMDIINAVTFSLLAVLVQFLLSNRSMRRIASEHFISMDHDTDGVTGLQNEAALRYMIDTYLTRRLDGEEGALILVKAEDCGIQRASEEDRGRIVAIAGTLRMLTSRYELIGRIGTDLFAVFYRECSRADAEKHRDKISAALIENPECGKTQISVVFTEPQDTFDTLYQRGTETLVQSSAGK